MTAPRFLTALRVEHVGEKLRRLLAPLAYESVCLPGLVIVPAEFVNDFASVPRLPVVYLAVGGLGDAAAVLHDWLYTAKLTTRAQADAVFREALIAEGVSRWRAWVMWAGVRAGGAQSWDAPGPEQPESIRLQLNPQ